MVTLHFNDKTLKIHEDDSSYRYRALMEKPTLTLKFSMPEFIEIPVGAWCEYQGEIYTLNKPENFKKQGSRRLEYTLTLGDPSELLGEYKVRNNVDRRLKWSMCAKPREFVQIIVENLNQRAGGGWSVGECIDATEKTIEFNHTYCDAALQSVSEVFNTEWEIIGKVFHLRKVEYFKDDPLPLGYGKGNGFKPGVGRSTESGQKPVKRLYVQGGSRNIDRSKYGAPDLLLPKSQTLEYEGRVYKADDDGYFIERYDKISSARKEDSLDCSEIYPSRVGEVTSVVTVDAAKNWYDFVDNTIPANLNFNDYLIEGETATIVFQSGMLAGDDKQFEFKYDHEKRRFEIKPQEIDGVTMPNASYKPQAGDRYAVFGIMLPNEYIRNDADKSGASWDMFREAARYLYENENPKFTFSGELQSLYTKKNWLRIGCRLKIGSYILFTDEQFAPDGVPIRIVGIKENLSSPYAPIITISNESHGTNITSKLNEISQNEVKIEESHNDAIRFTKRRFRDATETMSMLEDALLDNFTNSINPIAVRTMQMLVGDESLQFRFIQSRTSQTSVNLNITYNYETKRLNCPHGFLQHLTLGINTLAPSHKPNEYLVWEMNAYQSPQLTDGAKLYYLYARVHRTNTALVGSFLLSPTAIGMKQEANYYHLLVGVLNSEYDGERSFATLYGFTEILPGRVTTDKVVSADGNSFFDMLANAFKLGNKLRFNIDGDNKLVLNGTMVQSESGDEFPVPCYRGVWNARTTYYKGDLVSYNDGKGTSMYICIAPSYCTGRTPGGDGNAYWSLYASQGTNGDWSKLIYRYSIDKPATPVGNSPAGWSDTPDKDIIQFSHGSTFAVKNGFRVSPAITDGNLTKNRISFTTWTANQTVAIELVVSSEENYDFGILGLLDNAEMTRTTNYAARISGQTSQIFYVNVPTPGSHFVEVGYAKDSSTSKYDDCVKYRIITVENCWVSVGRFNGMSDDVGVWSVPVPFSIDTTDTERIYLLSDTDTVPNTPYSDQHTDDYVPTRTTETYNANQTYNSGDIVLGSNNRPYRCKTNNLTGIAPVTQINGLWMPNFTHWEVVNDWTDNPSGVTYSRQYEFESVRYKRDGVWGAFSTPTLWLRYALNGDFTEYRYAVNGSKTVAPALSKNTRNPSGWGVEQPTLDTLQYMWRTYAKISGETNELLSEWATPVRVTPYDGVDGKPGKDGKSPVLVFCGKYDSKKTYYGNEHRLDAVKYGDTFYIARIDAGTFYDVAPDNTSKWNSFGASFESIATNLLLAEGANIGDWFIKAGQIVSTLDDTSNNRILMQVGRYSGNTFIYEPKIILECSSSSGDYMMPGESSRGAIITLDATRGTVEARSKTDYDVSYMSPSGIFANRAGTEAMSATAGRTFRASLVGLGRANVNKSEWSLDKLGTLVMGVYGSSYNSGNAMAVGGFFDKLYAHGLILHRMAISGENVTKYLNYNDTMVVGYTSDAATVYLPANPYEGQVIFVKQWWSGYMRFRPRTGHCIYDDHTENEYYDFGEGYAGMFVFSIGYVTSGNTTTKKEAWLVSRWKY